MATLAVLEVEAPAPLVELSRDRYLDPVADFRVQLLRQLRRDALHREREVRERQQVTSLISFGDALHADCKRHRGTSLVIKCRLPRTTLVQLLRQLRRDALHREGSIFLQLMTSDVNVRRPKWARTEGSTGPTRLAQSADALQGYLAHKKLPPP